MRRVIAKAVAVLALVAGIAATATVPADAAPTTKAPTTTAPTTTKPRPVTTQDWWM